MQQEIKRFTVSDVRAMDENLLQALKCWPSFRRAMEAEAFGEYANHCSACGEVIADVDLHSEPEQVFFDITHAQEGTVRLVPLTMAIRLSGDEHFVVE